MYKLILIYEETHFIKILVQTNKLSITKQIK